MSSDDLTKSLDDGALLLQLVTLFREFDTRQREFGQCLQSLEGRLQSLEGRLQSVEGRLQSLEERLHSLETKVDGRLYDTRPMWEAVQLQITELRADTEKGFRRVTRKVTMFIEKVADLDVYQRDMEERLEKLEPKAS